MGDFMASIKIEMELLGIKDKCDMYINYSPSNSCDVDQRIIDFFEKTYEKAKRKYNDEIAAQYQKDHANEIKNKELAEFSRLKLKYREK